MTDATGHVSARRWRWLHRIGYVCTLIVLTQLIWAGALLTKAWWRQRGQAAEMRAHSRVHSGLLLSDPNAIDLDNGALVQLTALHPVSALGSQSVRLAVNPALSDQAYALALRRRGEKAEGVVIVLRHAPDGLDKRQAYHFQTSVAEFDQVMAQFDMVTDGYQGGDRLCTDGVEYAFERRSGPRVTSGTSVSSCDKTYERAAMLLFDFARRFAPLPKTLD
ncbi:hypothetical protein [Sphingomonas sanguinis]|nr:hypothetical protein [Sphingomonas sanguinis]